MDRVPKTHPLVAQLIVSGWKRTGKKGFHLEYKDWYARVLPSYYLVMISKNENMSPSRSYSIRNTDVMERIIQRIESEDKYE